MRFRNDETPRTISDLGLSVGPFAEFDWPGWNRAVHGHPPTGCTLLDPEPAPEADEGAQQPARSTSAAQGNPPAATKPAASTPASGDATTNQEPTQ